MKKFQIWFTAGGGEYAEKVSVKCALIEQLSATTVLVDSIEMEFDEKVWSIDEVSK